MSDTKILSAEEQVSILERAACTSHAAMKDAQAFADSHAAQEQRIAELESCIDKQEREHTRTMEQRDQFEERIGEIGSSLGLLEYDLEWSNLNDVGERCVQRANELVSQVDSACVVMNAFKGFQMLMDGKIDESTFNSIIKRAEADMARAAEWLNEYVNTAVEQLASTEERNKSIREELEQAQGQRDAALQRAEVAEAHNSAHKKALGEIFTAIDPCADDDQKACYTQKQALDCIKAGVDALDLLRQIREALPAERAKEIAERLTKYCIHWRNESGTIVTDEACLGCRETGAGLRSFAALVEEKP